MSSYIDKNAGTNECDIVPDRCLVGEIDHDLLNLKNKDSSNPMSLDEYQKYINDLFFK